MANLKQIESWWKHHQTKYITMAELVGPEEEFTVLLWDSVNNITVDTFDTVIRAKAFAFELHHNLLNAHETSFEIRSKLLKDEKELVLLLGRGDVSSACREVLDMCLCVVRDAIKDEVWMK